MIYYVSVPADGTDVFIKPSAAGAPLSRQSPAALRDGWANTELEKKVPSPYLATSEYRWWGWASSPEDAIRQAREEAQRAMVEAK
jgi:hypothetical protein